MIDVSSIINDPDFNVTFQSRQVTNTRDVDGSVSVVEAPAADRNGIVLPSKLDELKVLPEGERLAGSVSIYSLTEISMGEDVPGLVQRQADLIIYQGNYYRVAYTRFYEQCALWYAIATRIARVAP